MCQHTWAKNKAVCEKFLEPFHGLGRQEIAEFIDNPDARATWAERLSMEIDSLHRGDQLRQLINAQVGNTFHKRRAEFCHVLQQIAEELIGTRSRELTKLAY